MKMKLKKLQFFNALVVGFLSLTFVPASLFAETRSEPSIEQRLGDLEAYVNNGGRAADQSGATVSSKISGAGPGHNGWMMTSAALVLFMTLPGLALFYGGL